MKKNISINISGIIFHIEEDAYHNLKSYLETINKYFSSYEDSLEIISDIEGRIAEIFLTKLNEEKQVITWDDVEYLMSTMGTISDFEAAEEPESFASSEDEQYDDEEDSDTKSTSNTPPPNEEPRDIGKEKVFRDEKRKVLGGVAAGIAYYFSIDPLWIRLLLVMLLLNIFNLGISGAIFVAYLVLWIVIPESADLSDEGSIKKMFRSSENQVIGGVAGGLAAYFGVDLTIIRLLLVVSIFFGGFFLYLILWMITPLATTITEKMQMQGEPVTLSNIQQSVTNKLSRIEGEESPIAKILLFPFRVVAEIFKVIIKLIGPIGKVLLDLIRMSFGVIISLTGVVAILSIVLVVLILLGFLNSVPEYMMSIPVPVEIITSSFSPLLYVATLLCIVAPILLIVIVGVSLIANRFVINKSTGWSLLGVWLIGVIVISFTIPEVVLMFSNDGNFKESKSFDVNRDKPLLLGVNFVGNHDQYSTDLEIKSSQDSVVRLVVKKVSYGPSKVKAIENAQMIDYKVVRANNSLIFDSNFEFKNDAKFRGQSLDLTLYIPTGQVFVFDENMKELLTKRQGVKFGYFGRFGEGYRWVYDSDGLTCLNCQSDVEKNTNKKDKKRRKSDKIAADLEDFDEIEVRGFYNVKIRQADEYKIDIRASSAISEDVIVEKYGNQLVLDFEKNKWNLLEDLQKDNEIEVFITMPHLKQLKGSGMCNFDIRGFSEETVEMILSGATQCELDIDTKELELELSGASRIELSGSTDYFEADISGASTVRAYSLAAKSVNLSASGASNAKVSAFDELNVETSGFSNVRYKGKPDIKNIDHNGMSNVRRSDE